jgi:WxcM-like protein
MIWTSTGDFDPGTMYVVLASDLYDESDYYRSYVDFLRAVPRSPD